MGNLVNTILCGIRGIQLLSDEETTLNEEEINVEKKPKEIANEVVRPRDHGPYTILYACDLPMNEMSRVDENDPKSNASEQLRRKHEARRALHDNGRKCMYIFSVIVTIYNWKLYINLNKQAICIIMDIHID